MDGKKILAGKQAVLSDRSVIVLAEDENLIIKVIDDKTTKKSDKTKPKDEASVELNEEDVFTINGEIIDNLSSIEYDLLKYLYNNAGSACSYQDIREHVWHGGYVTNNTISSYVIRHISISIVSYRISRIR